MKRVGIRGLLGSLLVLAMLVHIERIIDTPYAPESVLIQVVSDDGIAEDNAACYGDITSLPVTDRKKQLRALQSIYDFLDPSIFFTHAEDGFHVFDTGLRGYRGDFDIRIVCYADGLSGVSYTIISNETYSGCTVRESGTVVIC